MEKRQKDLLKNLVRVAIGIGIIVFLFYKIGVTEIQNVIASANVPLLVLALAITLPTLFVKFARWKLVLNLMGAKLPFFSLAKIYLTGIFLGSVTPSKIGDLLKFYFLSKIHNMKSTHSLSVSILDRVFDLVFLLVVSIIGVVALISFISSFYLIFILAAFLILILLVFFNERIFTIFYNLFLPRLSFLVKFFNVQKINHRKARSEFFLPFKLLRSKPQYALAFISLTFLGWLLLALQTNVILWAFGQSLDIVYLLFFVSIGAVISLIPVTISGIGTRDAAMVFLFSIFGISSQISLSTSITYLVFSQLAPAVLGGVYYFTLRKK